MAERPHLGSERNQTSARSHAAFPRCDIKLPNPAPHPGITFSDFCATLDPCGSYYCDGHVPKCVHSSGCSNGCEIMSTPHTAICAWDLATPHGYAHLTQLTRVLLHFQASVFPYDPTSLSHHRQKHKRFPTHSHACPNR